MENDSQSHAPRPRLVLADVCVEIGDHTPVRDVSLSLQPGSVHCLVGDSGSGKTLTSLATVGLLPTNATATGSIRLDGVDDDLLSIGRTRWSEIRGSSIGYVGQNALGCLHPAFRIETQLIEAIRRHQPIGKAAAREIAFEALRSVDLIDTDRVARSHPAQLSGGMCQRVALAMALCNAPDVLIADEPTTALDADTQHHILRLVRRRVDDQGLAVLLITHDHSVVAEIADDITAITDGVSTPQPSLPAVAQRLRKRPAVIDPATEPTLEISGVGKTYGTSRRSRRHGPVVHDVNISAPAGTTIGLVGRSGAGKTTLAQIVAGVLPPTDGSVRIGGRPITGRNRVGRVEKAGLVQYVFQDPIGSLNPRRTALAQAAEPLIAAGHSTDDAKDRARELLTGLGLTADQIDRRPTALSGGQCQRVGIARALIRRPAVVVLDEPVSALDWSIRGEIISMLNDLQDTTGALYLLISHERDLVERESDRIYEVVDGAVIRR